MTNEEIQRFAEENPEAARKGQEQIQEVLERSATDWEFRQKLLSNPRKAIADHTGQDLVDIPQTIDLVFVENEADATVVLPDPIDPEAELSEGELEEVAGGTDVAAGVVVGVTYGVVTVAAGVAAGAIANKE